MAAALRCCHCFSILSFKSVLAVIPTDFRGTFGNLPKVVTKISPLKHSGTEIEPDQTENSQVPTHCK